MRTHVCMRACDTYFSYQTSFQALQNNISGFPDLENIIQEALRTRLIARASFSERFWEIWKISIFMKILIRVLESAQSQL